MSCLRVWNCCTEKCDCCGPASQETGETQAIARFRQQNQPGYELQHVPHPTQGAQGYTGHPSMYYGRQNSHPQRGLPEWPNDPPGSRLQEQGRHQAPVDGSDPELVRAQFRRLFYGHNTEAPQDNASQDLTRHYKAPESSTINNTVIPAFDTEGSETCIIYLNSNSPTEDVGTLSPEQWEEIDARLKELAAGRSQQSGPSAGPSASSSHQM